MLLSISITFQVLGNAIGNFHNFPSPRQCYYQFPQLSKTHTSPAVRFRPTLHTVYLNLTIRNKTRTKYQKVLNARSSRLVVVQNDCNISKQSRPNYLSLVDRKPLLFINAAEGYIFNCRLISLIFCRKVDISVIKMLIQ